MKNHLLQTISVITGGLLATALVTNAAARTVEFELPPPGDISTIITNPYFPLPMGMSYAYRGETEDGCEYNKVTVTTNTKMVTIEANVYTTLIVRDQAWEDEDCEYGDVALIEDTEDYYGLDVNTGNVVYFGEKTWAVTDESNECSDNGSWEAGQPVSDPEVDPAQPGIVMLGNPQPGERYMQEFLADVAEDWGAVQRLNAKVSIDSGEFTGCLMTREWSPLERGSIEHKFYCQEDDNPGPAGLLFVEELKGKNLYVEYIGPDFGAGGPLPGEGDLFPSNALNCELPAP